ncbi:MAG TPA: hypothetical protein VGQ34_01055 [Sphingomicrobium sp.]|nr:hypothetical protein [Sphingomicrobium sp.]
MRQRKDHEPDRSLHLQKPVCRPLQTLVLVLASTSLGGGRMHLHLPKPLHGWRAFVGEVGIIVLGVLIALGAEQAIQGFHDRHVAAQSRRDVREEVSTDLGFYRERLRESSCIKLRLEELSRIVQRGVVPSDR